MCLSWTCAAVLDSTITSAGPCPAQSPWPRLSWSATSEGLCMLHIDLLWNFLISLSDRFLHGMLLQERPVSPLPMPHKFLQLFSQQKPRSLLNWWGHEEQWGKLTKGPHSSHKPRALSIQGQQKVPPVIIPCCISPSHLISSHVLAPGATWESPRAGHVGSFLQFTFSYSPVLTRHVHRTFLGHTQRMARSQQIILSASSECGLFHVLFQKILLCALKPLLPWWL